MYFQITFQPIKSSIMKQVLLSSCAYLANNEPTMELSIRQFDSTNGNVTLKMFPSIDASFQHDIPYKVY